ncbi:MAG: VOC family protein [Mariniphaga sp.]
MKDKLIYGIQQIGIGVDDAENALRWYGAMLGSDVVLFDDSHEATFMSPYMGGKPHKKRAILAMNMQGGGGYEIWQYLDRKPQRNELKLMIGDFGINIAKVKSKDIEKSYERLQNGKVHVLSEIKTDPDGKRCFYICDPDENILQIKENTSWYSYHNKDTGGIFGCTIGVKDIDESLRLYSGILGYSDVIYDFTDHFTDLESLPNGTARFRRLLLSHSNNRTGGLSKLYGQSQIELIQTLDTRPKKIFHNRFWGDIGFIHLCFDTQNFSALIPECESKGFPFRVLSSESFDMGESNGRFGYIEDLDGTLIELVEVFKIPIIPKLNLNFNLKKRNPTRPLPDWLIKAMSIKRIKFKTFS